MDAQILSNFKSLKIKGTVFGNHSNVSFEFLNFAILAFSTNFCPIQIGGSGNTVLPKALGF